MILKLKPAFKDYIWGGTKLRDDFGFKSDLKKIAEGWMLSCHKDGENIIDGGKFDGKTLSEVINETGKDILGTKAQKYDFFPILIKLIDAKDNLSVQVHPNDDYALRVEGEYGKTECWYVIDCDEGAELIYGFKKKISNEEFRKRIEDNTFLDIVNHVKVKKGEFFFIESGTLHAIGKGILLAEIQQNSNTTYRVYDYNRLGADGKPRELHTEKALDVTKCEPPKNNGVMPPHTTNIANHNDALTWLFSMQLDRNPLMSHLRNSICNQANNIYLDDRKLSPLCLVPCLEYHQTVTVLMANDARLLTLD